MFAKVALAGFSGKTAKLTSARLVPPVQYAADNETVVGKDRLMHDILEYFGHIQIESAKQVVSLNLGNRGIASSAVWIQLPMLWCRLMTFTPISLWVLAHTVWCG